MRRGNVGKYSLCPFLPQIFYFHRTHTKTASPLVLLLVVIQGKTGRQYSSPACSVKPQAAPTGWAALAVQLKINLVKVVT